MLRGNRWQFVALFLSAVIFSLAAGSRFLIAPEPAPPTATPPPPSATAVSSVPTAVVTQQPTLAQPTQPVMSDTTPADSSDTIPTFTEALVGDVQRLNPLLATPAEQDITSLIFDGLTQINEFGEPVGDLAAEWVTSRNGLEYVVTLRDDVLWQDGTPFNADDVLYTMDILRSEDFPGSARQAAFWQTVEVEKLGEHLVRFRLAQPLASFPSRLITGILPYHALQGTTAAQLSNHLFNLSPIGTGPYQIEALRSADGVRLDAVDLRVAPTYQQRTDNPDAYAIDRVRFRIFADFDVAVAALQDGAVDALATRHKNDRPALLGVSSAEMYTGIESRVGILIYNRGDSDNASFFSDARVRNALQLGLERRLPVNSRLNNRAVLADTPLPFTSWAYAENVVWPSHNPARAAELLQTIQRPEAEETPEAVAVPPDSNPDTLYSFSILVPDDDAPRMALAQDIAAQWLQFNLDVTVESAPPQVFQERLEAGDFDTAIVEYTVGTDPDVYAYWHSGQYPDGLNYGGMLDSRVDETLERARREANGLNRDRLYVEFQAQFVSRGLAIPLYYPLYAYAVNDRIEGVQIGYMGSPEHRFRTLQDWRIASEN